MPACGECRDLGYLWVDERYVTAQIDRLTRPPTRQLSLVEPLADPEPTGPPLQLMPGTEHAIRDSVVPCFGCRPDQYRRWQDGRYRPSSSVGRPRNRT